MLDIDLTREYLEASGVKYREDMTGAECTSFKTGGRISLFVYPSSEDEAVLLFDHLKMTGVPFFIIGNGSNLLVPDEGLDTVIVKLSGELAEHKLVDNMLIAGAGASLAAVSKHSVLNGFAGLEWAAGIPGTVGGAVAMNAGAYGGEIKDVLCSVTVYKNGRIMKILNTDGSMGYRRSEFAFPNMIVLSAEFKLLPDDGSAKARMDEYNERRREKQPLSFPSAGSTFKRPKGHYAGALIEQAGLKGASVGGAQVSEKHAGFIINRGGATSDDVKELIKLVENTVFEKYGVWLEPEVKIL